MPKGLSSDITKNDNTKLTKRVFFSEDDDALELPNLVDHQNKSFQWFVDEG